MGLDVEASASLAASLGRLADAMSNDRARRGRIANGITYVPQVTAAVTALPAMLPADSFAPKTGYAWAVQVVRIGNLGAATDYVQLFRGKSADAARVAAPAWNTFFPSAAAPFAAPPWHPGKTAAILKDGTGIAVNGVVTGIGLAAPLIIEMDVIIIEIEQLPFFLL